MGSESKNEIYGELCRLLRDEKRAALVSRYEGGTVSKRLVRDDGSEIWEAFERTGEPVSFAQDGEAATLVEYYAPKPRLLILGGGHIALALSAVGAMLDFHVTVFDDRPIFANAERFPHAHAVICDSFANVMDRLQVKRSDYVVIVTRGHQHDTRCLKGVLGGRQIPYYIGMIGSSRRVDMVRRQLAAEGFRAEDIESVHSPIGLRIGAITPEEISVAILAEIVRHRRLGPDGAGGARRGMLSATSSDVELAAWLADSCGEACAAITVVSTRGSTPRETGAKMAVGRDGSCVGTIGGGCVEAGLAQDARSVIRNGGYMLKTIDLTDSAEDEGMVCGGTMTVVIESLEGL
jgi:xanthine dehydrogenase accessory factor